MNNLFLLEGEAAQAGGPAAMLTTILPFVLMIVVSLGVFFGSCLGRGVAVFSVVSLPHAAKERTIARTIRILTSFFILVSSVFKAVFSAAC